MLSRSIRFCHIAQEAGQRRLPTKSDCSDCDPSLPRVRYSRYRLTMRYRIPIPNPVGETIAVPPAAIAPNAPAPRRSSFLSSPFLIR